MLCRLCETHLYIYYSLGICNCPSGVMELRVDVAGDGQAWVRILVLMFIFHSLCKLQKTPAGSTGFQVIPAEFGPIGYR